MTAHLSVSLSMRQHVRFSFSGHMLFESHTCPGGNHGALEMRMMMLAEQPVGAMNIFENVIFKAISPITSHAHIFVLILCLQMPFNVFRIPNNTCFKSLLKLPHCTSLFCYKFFYCLS